MWTPPFTSTGPICLRRILCGLGLSSVKDARTRCSRQFAEWEPVVCTSTKTTTMTLTATLQCDSKRPLRFQPHGQKLKNSRGQFSRPLLSMPMLKPLESWGWQVEVIGLEDKGSYLDVLPVTFSTRGPGSRSWHETVQLSNVRSNKDQKLYLNSYEGTEKCSACPNV